MRKSTFLLINVIGFSLNLVFASLDAIIHAYSLMIICALFCCLSGAMIVNLAGELDE